MMNDSVRAEVLSKISVSKQLRKLENAGVKETSPASGSLNLPPAQLLEKANQSLPPVFDSPKNISAVSESPKNVPITFEKSATSELGTKPTSPTLVEFHSKNSSVPEWRLQLQNTVRQRNDRENQQKEQPVKTASARQAKPATSGANALKIDMVEDRKPARVKNPTLSSALARIEKSRQKFLVEEALPVEPVASPSRPANKNFPFYIASKQSEAEAKTEAKTIAPGAPASFADKPKLAAPVKIDSGDLNTNKLPPLSAPVKASTNFAKIVETPVVEVKKAEKKEIAIKSPEPKEIVSAEDHFGEFEDAAPFAMRFNAGIFDLIIGGFLSLFLLAPFMLTGGDWFTFTGLLAFMATCSIVMFIYLTTTTGFYGRTFGMRIFSLEVVDIDGENYPTMHQAAVSSAVYVLSLVCGGVGFLTMLFNPEKRAAHDLISGTMVVREN